MIQNYFLYIFIGITLLQILFFCIVFGKTVFTKKKALPPKRIPISVLVYVKNNKNTFIRLMSQLETQQYHNFEIVLVMHTISEEMIQVCREFAVMYENVRLANLTNDTLYNCSKSYITGIAVKAANNKHILLIDSDQTITSDQWIWQMSANFTMKKNVVIGMSHWKKEKGIFNKWLRFQQQWEWIQNLSFSRICNPFSLYPQNLGFQIENIYDKYSNIDLKTREYLGNELLFPEFAQKSNTFWCELPTVSLETPAPKNRKEWNFQKKQQYFQKNRQSWGTNIFSFLHLNSIILSYLVTPIAILLFPQYIIEIASCFVAFWAIRWMYFSIYFNKINQKDLKIWYPFFEISWLIGNIKWFPYTLKK